MAWQKSSYSPNLTAPHRRRTLKLFPYPSPAKLCPIIQVAGYSLKINPHSPQLLSLFICKGFSGKSTGRTGPPSPGCQQPTAGHHLTPCPTQEKQHPMCIVHNQEMLDNYYRWTNCTVYTNNTALTSL